LSSSVFLLGETRKEGVVVLFLGLGVVKNLSPDLDASVNNVSPSWSSLEAEVY
jgi:hypothetical protein